LRLATAVLDVHPPRARPWVKRLRRYLPLHAVSARLRDAAGEVSRQVSGGAEAVRFPLPASRIISRLVVPGWAHFYCGQVQLGWGFLGSYLVLLALGLLFLGTGLGSFLLGLAFSVHASSALSILFQTPGEMPSRLLTTVVVALVLALGVYLPAGWLLTRVADPHTTNLGTFPFDEGDVVLVNQWAYWRSPPEVGQVVLYESGGATLPTRRAHTTIRIRAGQQIDRILAGPGSQVRWENGTLYVDGNPSPWRPLNATQLPAHLAISVPEGCYCILPSTMAASVPAGYEVPTALWESLSVVGAGRIQGVVYWRHQPLNRWGIIR
jgi:hypothetical protein